jgi:hypothetical protein
VKKKIFLLFFSFLLLPEASFPLEPKGFGIGVIIGAPTGISMKLWMNPRTGLDGAISWSGYGIYVHGDYLLHNYQVFPAEGLPLYYGFGVRLIDGEYPHLQYGHDHYVNIGIRGVIGIEYFIPNVPFDVFLELAPTLNIVPGVDLDIYGGLGVRFFF